jgi:hypothetical protein
MAANTNIPAPIGCPAHSPSFPTELRQELILTFTFKFFIVIDIMIRHDCSNEANYAWMSDIYVVNKLPSALISLISGNALQQLHNIKALRICVDGQQI